jgi:type IV pilus assembly protein PilC
MWFSKQLPLQGLIELTRALRHNLSAGLTLLDVFRQQARRGPPAVRPVAARITTELEKGESLEAALDRERDYFPPLFIDIALVGEESGNLPEMFGELEEYYRLQQSLIRQFRSQIILPVMNFFLAILVIAFMLFVLGVIAESHNTQATDPTGFGFTGKKGALRFLCLSFGLILILYLGYKTISHSLRHKAAVDTLLLRIPVVGPCLEAFALGRFTLALALTLESSMPITRALRLSLRATANGAYIGRTDLVVQSLRAGDDLNVALTKARIFPVEFLNIVAVGEEGGRVPDAMRHQAKYYQEEAGRRLTALTKVASFSVWLIYAVFMVIMIMRLAMSYINAISNIK